MPKFDIKLTPESKHKIDQLARAGKVDLRPIFRTIGVGYRKEVAGIFGKQQPRGEDFKWPPLSPKYAAWKAKKFPGKPILQRTGALIASMTSEGANGNISLIGKASAVFGTSVAYGIYHDEGGKRLPRRNFSEPSERRRDIWVQQVGRAIAQNFEKNKIEIKGTIFE